LLKQLKKEVKLEKEWWKSVTIWSQIMLFISFVLRTFGWVEITPETQATLAEQFASIATSVAIVIGIVLTVIRRFKKETIPIIRKIV
jgi:hypothetical protein